jgi:fructokinase
MSLIRFGIDLGGTKIEIIAIDPALKPGSTGSDNVLYQKRIETPSGDYVATLNVISQLVLEAEEALSQKGSVGIGIPGSISHKTGKIKNANSTWLMGQDLQADLQQRLNRPIALANDANCFALSEALEGSAQGSEVVFGVIIGTGCGGGIVVNGQILNGINAIGGEWGHNPLPWLDADELQRPCYCGLKGCNETFLSGSGFEAHYSKRMNLTNSPGLVKTAKQIVELSLQGDEMAQQLMHDYTIWLAKGLASVINLLDPDVIVLGGGMSNIQSLYTDIPRIWGEWVFSDQLNTRLVAPKFGDASGVRGAAWL